LGKTSYAEHAEFIEAKAKIKVRGDRIQELLSNIANHA